MLRINRRWIDEVVVRFGVCPFAARALTEDHVARRVLDGAGLDEGVMRATVDALAADEAIEVALLVFPRLQLDAAAFDKACLPWRAAHPAFVAAVFHPDAAFDARTPAQAVGFFRRAPDPTLQLVRQRVLDAVKGERGGKFHFDYSPAAFAELERRAERVPVSERIARDNQQLLLARAAELQQIYDDIRADRDRCYGRAGG